MPAVNLPADHGVLSKESRGAYKLIVFVMGWFVAGVAAAVAVFSLIGQPAHAASAGVERQLATIVSDISAIKQDMAAVKCRVNMGNSCPP